MKHLLTPSARCRLSVFGLATDKAKVNFWRHESLPLPLPYLDEPALAEELRRALKFAEAVASDALRPAAWGTASNRLAGESGQRPDKKRVSDVVASFAPERLYWSRLEAPFRELLVDLAGDVDKNARVVRWYWDSLHPAAVAAFERTIGRIDSGRDLKAVSAGRAVLSAKLKQVRAKERIPERRKEGAA